MKLVFIDEANQDPNPQNVAERRFLVVGAVIIDSDEVLAFSDSIERIRADNGFNRCDSLKYALADKPDHVSNDQHRQAKSQLLEAAARHNVKLIAYVAHHQIIDGNGIDAHLNWAIDQLLTKIQQFMNENAPGDPFYCLVDRHSRAGLAGYLRNRFQERNHQERPGFNTPSLAGTGIVWDGTAHLTSLCDIVTGSFTYIVNNPHRDIAGRAMIQLLRPLIWGVPGGDGRIHVRHRGLLFRPDPENIRAQNYREEYEEVIQRVVQWANNNDGNQR
jgi:hypothetical protein